MINDKLSLSSVLVDYRFDAHTAIDSPASLQVFLANGQVSFVNPGEATRTRAPSYRLSSEAFALTFSPLTRRQLLQDATPVSTTEPTAPDTSIVEYNTKSGAACVDSSRAVKEFGLPPGAHYQFLATHTLP